MSERHKRIRQWAKERVMSGEPNKTPCDVSGCSAWGQPVIGSDLGRVLCHFHETKRHLWAKDNAREIGYRAAQLQWDQDYPRKGKDAQ